jgi:hypothetical protein
MQQIIAVLNGIGRVIEIEFFDSHGCYRQLTSSSGSGDQRNGKHYVWSAA